MRSLEKARLDFGLSILRDNIAPELNLVAFERSTNRYQA
jgi:hypothetical protein